MQKLPEKKIVIAAGGTGGHLFPAQALAAKLKDPVLFLGKGLSSNRFFYRERFAFQDIESSSFSLNKLFSFSYHLAKGTWQAIRALRAYKPTLVIGFGSFHCFPVLLAAFFLRLPIILFESNAFPGKVNRLFSPLALFTGVQFASAACHLKGKCFPVAMPVWCKENPTKEEAFAYFSLKPGDPVILVFGGSQGALAINKAFLGALPLKAQVIHLIGRKASCEEMQAEYARVGVIAVVKPFEENMHFAYKVADLAICRAGAATISELLHFSIPSILIPYPSAADDHQKKNALFLEEIVKASFCLEEKELSSKSLSEVLQKALQDLPALKAAALRFSKEETPPSLESLVEGAFSLKEPLLDRSN